MTGWSAGLIEDEDVSGAAGGGRVFTLELYESHADAISGEQTLTLTYPLTGTVHSGTVTVPVNAAWRSAELSASESLSDLITAETIELSDLSFRILGQDTGLYQKETTARGSSLAADEETALALGDQIADCVFLTDGGQEIAAQSDWALGTLPEGSAYSLLVACGSFVNEDGERIMIDADTVTAVRIGGVEYTLE